MPVISASRVVVQEIDREIERLEQIEADDLAIRLRLPEWGYWARTYDHGLGYASPVTVFRARGQDATTLRAVIPRIPDDLAIQIDSAISALDTPYRHAIRAAYLDLVPYRKMTRQQQRHLMIGVGKLSMILPC